MFVWNDNRNHDHEEAEHAQHGREGKEEREVPVAEEAEYEHHNDTERAPYLSKTSRQPTMRCGTLRSPN